MATVKMPTNGVMPDATTLHRCPKHPEKTQYEDSKRAHLAAERVMRENPALELHVYACDHCGYMHLSKKAGSEAIGPRVRLDGKVYATGSAWVKPAIPTRNPEVLAAAEEATRKADGIARFEAARTAHNAQKVAEKAERAAAFVEFIAHDGPINLEEYAHAFGIALETARAYAKLHGWRYTQKVGGWVGPGFSLQSAAPKRIGREHREALNAGIQERNAKVRARKAKAVEAAVGRVMAAGARMTASLVAHEADVNATSHVGPWLREHGWELHGQGTGSFWTHPDYPGTDRPRAPRLAALEAPEPVIPDAPTPPADSELPAPATPEPAEIAPVPAPAPRPLAILPTASAARRLDARGMGHLTLDDLERVYASAGLRLTLLLEPVS